MESKFVQHYQISLWKTGVLIQIQSVDCTADHIQVLPGAIQQHVRAPNYSYFVLFNPHLNIIQNCWEVWDYTEGEKTEENRQMSMLLMVISSERLWGALNTISENCCSLTLQFSNKLWSWRVVFSFAPNWGVERAPSANQNQRCNSLAPCVGALQITSTGQ